MASRLASGHTLAQRLDRSWSAAAGSRRGPCGAAAARRARVPDLRPHRDVRRHRLRGRPARPRSRCAPTRAGSWRSAARRSLSGYRGDPRRDRGRLRPSRGGCAPTTSARSTRTGISPCSAGPTTPIRSGGETIWPEEVEAVLARHPKVADVAVAGRPDPEWGAHVAAWVVPRLDRRSAEPGGAPRALPGGPGAVQGPARSSSLVVELPRTANGKLRRAALGTAPRWVKARAREGFARAFGSRGAAEGVAAPRGSSCVAPEASTDRAGRSIPGFG